MAEKQRRFRKKPPSYSRSVFSENSGFSLLILSEKNTTPKSIQVSRKTVVSCFFILLLSVGGLVRVLVACFTHLHSVIVLNSEQNKNTRLELGGELLSSYLDETIRRIYLAGEPIPSEETGKSEICKAGLAVYVNNRTVLPDFAHLLDPKDHKPTPALFHAPSAEGRALSVIPEPDFICPTEGRITSHFGWRTDPVFEGTALHNGIDIAGPIGTPISSASEGTVLFAGKKRWWGNVVILNHYESGYQTVYAHLNKISVNIGDTVGTAQVLGFMGSTGKSTGPHLHYEVRYYGKPVNPLPFLLPKDTVVD